VTEKYLDFSFEKTNSAYMLFYERRAKEVSESKSSTSQASNEVSKNEEAQASTSAQSDESKESMENDKSSKSNDDDHEMKEKRIVRKKKSLLSKELEEWIWQDNRHYLEDRNIFEHTYFK
jgi:ubiquitin carboxyl-terminal hydrolase 34